MLNESSNATFTAPFSSVIVATESVMLVTHPSYVLVSPINVATNLVAGCSYIYVGVAN